MPDSNILISHLNHELDVFAFLGTLPEYEFCVSIIAAIETLAKPNITAEEEQRAKMLLARFPQVDIADPVKNEAVSILRRKLLKLPDAVIAATAVLLNATLLSNDPHLTKFTWPGYTVRSVQ
jgi:predicted nucleic acid-binding protein